MNAKKLLLALVLFLTLATVSKAQEPDYKLYFPIMHPLPFNPCRVEKAMSDFKVIVPVESVVTNKVKNPSGEIAGNFAALAGTTVTRETTVQHYGLYSYRIQSNANNEGATFDLEALDNTDHWITIRVSGTLPASWDWSLDNATYTSPTLIETIDSQWKLYALSVPAAQANGSVLLYVRQNGAGAGDFWIDGIQVEAEINATWTTYCDGTQEGCEWNGTPHSSSSQRSDNSRAGGVVADLEDDYGLKITGFSGTGTAPQELFSDSYSQLPGGELNAIKTNSRVFTLTGLISEATEADFYQVKQTLESLFDAEAFPEDENGPQPIRLRFTGAAVHKEIAVHYEGGLEANITADDPCAWEKVAIRFLADDPYWYEIGESAALLDTEDSATFRTVAARLRSTGQWSPLGPPGTGGSASYNTINGIVEDGTYIYFGGNFTNFDGNANSDRVVRYNKQTGAYSSLGTGANATIWTLAIGPDGLVYAGGDFTSIGGTAATRVAYWDGAAWNAMSTGFDQAPLALIFSPDGVLYAGGGASVANAVAYWDGAAWNGIAGTGTTGGGVQDMVFTSDGLLYAVGAFTAINGVTVNGVATWDGSIWSDLNGGSNGSGFALAVTPTNLVYVGGNFTTIGGVSANRIAIWNGATFTPLGDGVDGQVTRIAIGPDGLVYVAGSFTSAGGITLADRVARWNGYSWSHLDIDLPGSPTTFYVYPSKYVDPVVSQKYNLYLGFNTSGTGLYAGLETVTNGGTAHAFPKIIFSRSGGTSAIIETVRNERTGLELLLNWPLQDSETLTIDLAPTKKSISSSTGSPAQGAILPNSDFGDWSLLKGDNDITSFVANDGATVTGYLLWKDRYKSQN